MTLLDRIDEWKSSHSNSAINNDNEHNTVVRSDNDTSVNGNTNMKNKMFLPCEIMKGGVGDISISDVIAAHASNGEINGIS